MKTILIFAGTRPEIIKMAPVVRELRARHRAIPEKKRTWCPHFCFSGQHYELALAFLRYFDIEADSELDLMVPGQRLGQLAARAAVQMDRFFAKRADACAALVQGDT